MKNPLHTLLMFFAICLCALCSWQWYGQVLQKREMTVLAQKNYDQSVQIDEYTRSIKNMDQHIAQLDARLTQLRGSLTAASTEVFTLRQDNARFNSMIEQYKTATETLQAQIKQANESIRRQNDTMKTLVDERNDYVNRLNETIKERNEIVTKYNEVAKQIGECMKERNEIVTKYNELVKQFEELAAKQRKK
jgi:chromosome segregation ATPase